MCESSVVLIILMVLLFLAIGGVFSEEGGIDPAGESLAAHVAHVVCDNQSAVTKTLILAGKAFSLSMSLVKCGDLSLARLAVEYWLDKATRALVRYAVTKIEVFCRRCKQVSENVIGSSVHCNYCKARASVQYALQ